MDYNRLSVIRNEFQKDIARILCVCSGGVLRSPTCAWILSNPPYDFNTRSAGTEDYALIRVDEALLQWSHGIVVMEDHHEEHVVELLEKFKLKRPTVTLNIEDQYAYKDAKLIKLIHEKLPIMLGDRITVKR